MEPTDRPGLDALAERIAREFHTAYEQLGPVHGWVSQESARGKDFDELPESNRALMVATVKGLLIAGVIDPGPALLDTFCEAGATDAH